VSSNDIWQLSRQQSWQDASATKIFGAAVLLALVRVALVVLGFHRTVKLVRRLSGGRQRDQVRDVELAAAAYRVAAASAFIPYGRKCLDRSLVLFYQLKREGVPVALRVGASARPFVAHAWVEYNGQPVNEHRESIKDYSLLLEIR
jgi:hypothetical protein